MSRLAWCLSVIPLGAFVASIVISMGVTGPAMLQQERLHARIAATRQETWRRKAEAREIGRFEAVEAPLLQAACEALERAIPPGDRPERLWSLFQELAEKTGVRLLACKRGAVESEDAEEALEAEDGETESPEPRPGPAARPGYRALLFRLEVDGAPDRILAFLMQLETRDRPISLREVDLQRVEERFLTAKGRITVRVVVRA